MPDRILELFNQFMKANFPNVQEFEPYFEEWKKRFEDGWEWQKSGYKCRQSLQLLGPEIYPIDRDEFFQRVD